MQNVPSVLHSSIFPNSFYEDGKVLEKVSRWREMFLVFVLTVSSRLSEFLY